MFFSEYTHTYIHTLAHATKTSGFRRHASEIHINHSGWTG